MFQVAGNGTFLNDTASGAVSFAGSIESIIASYTGLNGAASDVVAAVSVFLLFFVLSFIARVFVTDVAPHLVSRTKSSLDDELLGAVKRPIQVLIIAAGVYLACKTLNDLPHDIASAMDSLATVALILIAAYFITSIISGLLRWYIRDVAPKTDSDLDDHLIPFLEKIIVAVVYILALLMSIAQLGVQITPLIASMGVAGVAVALAAKESLSNLFGAMAVLADRPFKVGDRLNVTGVGLADVVDIGLRSTRVKTLDNRIAIIPNEELARTKIVNYSLPDPRLRLAVKVDIGYGADVDKACAIMEEIASGLPAVSNGVKPRAYVSDLKDYAIEITMYAWVDTYLEHLNVPDEIYRKILVRFRQEGIEIPCPVMTIVPRVTAS